MNRTFGIALVASLTAIATPQIASAQVTHTGIGLIAGGVAPTSPFDTLAEAVGTQAIDYSFGNAEGIFSDPPFKLCGINGANVCDLLTAVDGRIVVLGTTNQGLTSGISILPGSQKPMRSRSRSSGVDRALDHESKALVGRNIYTSNGTLPGIGGQVS